MQTCPSREDIERAAALIEPFVTRTTIRGSGVLDDAIGAKLFCKMENEQPVGAFKARAAMYAVLMLADHQKRAGVLTQSSGNHGQALAWAAKQQNVSATIVVPRGAPRVKVEGMLRWGAHIVECEPTQRAREETAERLRAETGAELVPPYNDLRVITGQATAAQELIQDSPEPLDIIVTPVGGGGLLSGTLASVAAYDPQIKVYAAEPEEADDARRSLATGKLQSNDPAKINDTLADGLRMSLGDKTFGIIRQFLRAADILLVTNGEILEAMKMVRDCLNVVIEPSSATAFAAIRKTPDLFRGRRVGVIVTGGNVDREKFSFLP